MKHYEFWHPRIFEFPWYIYLAAKCVLHQIPPNKLVKANYGLAHGAGSMASKMEVQKQFGEEHFPATIFLSQTLSAQKKMLQVTSFAKKHGYPLFLKPDMGFCGKAVVKIDSKEMMTNLIPTLKGDYLCQAFLQESLEFGIFVVRYHNKASIFSINSKTYPSVKGDGASTILELAQQHSRFSPHWNAFLMNHDLHYVPQQGEIVQLSFIGSHTLGCMFADATSLATPSLCNAIAKIIPPGFNFGRLDVKTQSIDDLKKGNFKLIEVNGIHSISTNIFDPNWTLWKAYQTLFKQTNFLVKIAKEHKHKTMDVLPLFTFVKKFLAVDKQVNSSHKQVLRGAP